MYEDGFVQKSFLIITEYSVKKEMISLILHCQLQVRPALEPRSPEACPSHCFSLTHSTCHLVPAAKVPAFLLPRHIWADTLSQAQLHSRHHNPEAFFSSRRTGQFPSRAAHAVSAAPVRTRVAHSLVAKSQAGSRHISNPLFSGGPCVPARQCSTGIILGAGGAGKLGSNSVKGIPLRSQRGGRDLRSGSAACFCAQTLAAAAAEETGDPLGFHRRGWRSLSVPSGKQPHCPLREATRKPEGCPGSSDGTRARQNAPARAKARQSATGCRAPHAHQPLGWGASEAARGGRRPAASCARAARARGWAWEARARLARAVRARFPHPAPAPSLASLPARPWRASRGAGGWGEGGGAAGPEGPERLLRSPSQSWARAAAVATAAAAGEDGGAGGRSGWRGALFPDLAPTLSLAPPAPAGPRTQLSGKVPPPGRVG